MVRFLADADLNEGIVAGYLRREPTTDFLSANEANREGLPDPKLLALATEQNRILVSHDFQTMPHLKAIRANDWPLVPLHPRRTQT